MKHRRKVMTRTLRGYRIDDSSNVEFVGWDHEGNMYVRYKNGGFYKYKGVTRQRVVATALAPSVGKYIASKIKPQFAAVKVA